MKYKITVVTATRAEYGLLSSVIRQITNDPLLELDLIVTGTHLEEYFGNTYQEIERDGFVSYQTIPIYAGTDEAGILEGMANAASKIGTYLSCSRPDVLVMLGDRFELYPIAGCCVALHIPIAHISGGEISEGAQDEYFRHAITKMASMHFTSNESCRKRVVQMGENPNYVFNVGDLGIENIKTIKFLSKRELEEDLGIQFTDTMFQVTFHPVTTEYDSVRQLKALLDVFSRHEEYQVIFTRPNADSQGLELGSMIDQFVETHAARSKVFPSLGYRRYLSLLSFCTAIVGNSSSGIVEAPYLHIGVIDVGNRQKGRECAASVIHCPAEEEALEQAFETVCSTQYKNQLPKVKSPYEAENTAERIVDLIKRNLSGGLQQKRFFDLEENSGKGC